MMLCFASVPVICGEGAEDVLCGLTEIYERGS